MSTKEILVGAGAERLAEVLLHLQESHEDMKKQFEMLFQGLDSNPKKLISMIKKEISSLDKAKVSVKDQKVLVLRDRLNQLKYSISKDLKRLDAVTAKSLMWDFLELHVPTLYRMYHNEGVIIEVFKNACFDLAQIYAEFRDEKEGAIVDAIFNCFDRVGYRNIYTEMIPAFKDVLGKEGLQSLGGKLEKAISKKNLTVFKLALQQIADLQKDVNAYIKASKLLGSLTAEEYLDIAQRLIEKWRGEEAMQWIDDASIDMSMPLRKRKIELKLQALDLLGDYLDGQNERMDYFKQTMEVWMYGEILKYAKPEDKDSFIKNAIDWAIDHKNFYVGMNFLIEMKEFISAGIMVRKHINKILVFHYAELNTYAKELKEFDPLASILIYRKFMVLEKHDSYEVCKYLVLCEAIEKSVEDWESYDHHTIYLEKLLEQHKKNSYFRSVYDYRMMHFRMI